MDGRKNNKGTKGNKGGNPGYGALKVIRENVEKHCPEWWEQWQKMLKGTAEEKRLAMQEFNKLQIKLMPTMLGNEDDKPLVLQFNEVFRPSRPSGENNREPEKV